MSNLPDRDPNAEALARQRFFALAFLRFSGVAFAMCGIAMMVGKFPPLRGHDARFAGLAIAFVGAFDVIVLPVILTRLWKRDRGSS
jgi:hypothetical protein